MATQRITTDLHSRQARPGQELAVADTPGLRLRVYPSGVKSWMYRYRVPVLNSDGNPVMAGEHSKTRLRKIVLGGYPAVSLKEARRKCQEQKSLRSDRGDPIEVKRLTPLENVRRAKREKEAAEQDAFTVDRLANVHVEKHALARKQSWREDQRIFKKYIVPALGADTPLHRVRRKDVLAMLDTIASSAPVQANRVPAVSQDERSDLPLHNWTNGGGPMGSVSIWLDQCVGPMGSVSIGQLLGPLWAMVAATRLRRCLALEQAFDVRLETFATQYP